MDKGDKLIKKPVYPGGRKAMSEFIQGNIEYPDRAKEKKIEGLVVVVIDIDNRGHVIRSKVKKSLGYGCDEEAQRVASLLKFRTDPKRKQRVTFHRTINIHFRLPKKKVVPPKVQEPRNIQVTYTFVPAKKK